MEPRRASDRVRACAALLTVLLVGACACRCGGSGTRDAPPSGAKAILLITVEGLVGERLSVFGGDVGTPSLESIARDGVAWRDAWTVCPMSRPAVATYLTGVSPDRHQVWDDLFTPLAPEAATLAEALQAAGYETAAFPGTSFLGRSSGVLQGFDVVDDPPQQALWQRLPRFKEAATIAQDVKSWLTGRPSAKPYFAWIHFADPGQAQLDEKPGGLDEATRAVDSAIGEILTAVRDRGGREGAAIVVAGTYADLSGGGEGVPGAGFSVDERAVRVPVIARLPGAAALTGVRASPVWAPDIAFTLARVGGVRLDASEGIDLREPAPPGRLRFAWSRAPRDQMGWQPLTAARRGVSEATEALALRPVLRAGDTIGLDRVQPVLAALGVKVRPLPAAGREFGPKEKRRAVGQSVWAARRLVHARKPKEALDAYATAARLDPQALAPLLEQASLTVTGESRPRGADLLREAAGLYPWSPEALHLYGHLIFLSGSRGDAETLWTAVLQVWPTEMDVLYDLACMRSLAGDLEASEGYLRRAVQNGFSQWVHIESDPDLRNLRASPRFAALMKDLRR